MVIRAWAIVAACCATVRAEPKPCGDATQPKRGKVKPTSGEATHARVVATSRGAVIGMTVYGKLPIPHHTATSDAPETDIEMTWLYTLAGDRLETIGALGTPARLVEGSGAIVVDTEQPTLCVSGGRRKLPAPPHAGYFTSRAVDGATLVHVTVETRSSECNGTGAFARAGMLGGLSTVSRIVVDQLDTAAASPQWTTTATHDFPKLVYPKGCPTQTPDAFDLTAASQAIVLRTCTGIDAGDTLALRDCKLELVSLRGAAWRQVALDGEVDMHDAVLVSARDGEAHVAGGTFQTHWVYDIAPTAKSATRTPLDVSSIVSLSGDRMIVWNKDDALEVRARAGGWKPAGKPFATPRALAVVGWLPDRAIVVLPEDAFDGKVHDPAIARVLELRGTSWRALGKIAAVVAP